MRRYTIGDLKPAPDGAHMLFGMLSGERLYRGGTSFHRPGLITHDDERPHLETDEEIFVLLQGEGMLELDGEMISAKAGDIFVIEPGEDHHLHSSEHNPFVNLWLHAQTKAND